MKQIVALELIVVRSAVQRPCYGQCRGKAKRATDPGSLLSLPPSLGGGASKPSISADRPNERSPFQGRLCIHPNRVRIPQVGRHCRQATDRQTDKQTAFSFEVIAAVGGSEVKGKKGIPFPFLFRLRDRLGGGGHWATVQHLFNASIKGRRNCRR